MIDGVEVSRTTTANVVGASEYDEAFQSEVRKDYRDTREGYVNAGGDTKGNE